MERIGRVCGAAIMTLAFSGCANWNAIHKEFTADKNKVGTIDAKQRVVSMSVAHDDSSGNGSSSRTKYNICVEQSPDVFSFLNSSLGVSAEAKAAAASLAAAVAESGGSLAFRTQVTQAQTNFLYSVCQLHANGALSDQAVRTEMRRFQQTLLGILAIEQMTSPYRTQPSQTILSTSTASVGKDVDIAQTKVNSAKTEVTAKEDAVAAADAKLKAAAKDSEASKQAQSEKEQAEVDLKKAKENLDIAQKQLTAARLALDASAGGSQQSVINVYTSPSTGPTKDIAEQVVRALETVIQRGAVLDYCAELILEGRRQPTNNRSQVAASTAVTTSDSKEESPSSSAPNNSASNSTSAGTGKSSNAKIKIASSQELEQAAINTCQAAFETYLNTYADEHQTYNRLISADSELRHTILVEAKKLYETKKISVEDYRKLLLSLTSGTGQEAKPPAPPPKGVRPPNLFGNIFKLPDHVLAR